MTDLGSFVAGRALAEAIGIEVGKRWGLGREWGGTGMQ